MNLYLYDEHHERILAEKSLDGFDTWHLDELNEILDFLDKNKVINEYKSLVIAKGYMKGNRRADNTSATELKVGEYAYQTWLNPPCWFIRDPLGSVGTILSKENGGHHDIVVNTDDTITVSPSILNRSGTEWHGFLENGIWRSV